MKTLINITLYMHILHEIKKKKKKESMTPKFLMLKFTFPVSSPKPTKHSEVPSPAVWK